MTRPPRAATWLVAALSVLVLTGCADRADRVVVSAASSLTEVFQSLAEAYGEQDPDVDIVLNLGGSAALREQILGGAPADVFAPAAWVHMDAVSGQAVGDPAPFATNTMTIAVTAGNPAGIEGLADFAKPAPFLGACASGVPCGDLADEVFAAAGVDPELDSREPSVRSVLTKVEAGDLDAGIVYATDVRVAEVESIAIPDGVNAATEYPIVALSADDDAAGFVSFVLSPEGQAILEAHGFGSP